MSSFSRDDWLTRQLGKPCYTLKGPISKAHLADLPLGPGLVSAFVDTGDLEQVFFLSSQGFYIVSGMLTFENVAQSLLPIEPNLTVELGFATDGDASTIIALAEQAFSSDRFHGDPLIDNQVASKIKSDWAGNFFRGLRGQWMVVARIKGRVVGFVQVLKKSDDILVIDLIALDSAFQGQGIAKGMILFMVQNCASVSSRVSAGTQISNIGACNLYQSLGFHITSSYYVLHKHL